MSASAKAPSPDACLDCGARTASDTLARETIVTCTACGSLRIEREVLGRLRRAPPAMDPRLMESPPDRPDPKPGQIRKCPVCKGPLLMHPFGGGNVRVESCEECELVYLPRGRLSAIVKEAREGIEMSDAARDALAHQRLLAAGKSFSAAEFGMSTAALVALLLFFRIVVRTGFSTTAIAAGAVIAVGLLVYLQWKWRRQRAEAADRMDRLAEEELRRHSLKGSDGSGGGDKPVPVRLSVREKPAALRTCPVCRAALPPNSTHCTACDSDFG